jgi:hypothetical protein
VGNTGETPTVLVDGIGSHAALVLRRANGTGTTPVANGDILGHMAVRGYGSTGYNASGNARLQFIALQNFTDVAQGTRIELQTTPLGSNTLTTQAIIGPGLVVGNPTPAAAPVFGDINATRVMVNGQPLTPGGIPEAPVDSAFYGRRNAAWSTGIPTAGGTISGTAPGSLTINRNPVLPAPPANSTPVLWGVGNAAEQTSVVLDGVGNMPQMILRRANSTGTAPVNSGDVIGQIAVRGYGATGYAVSGNARIQFVAVDTFSDTVQGTRINLQTSPAGTNVVATQAAISTGLEVGTPTLPVGGMLFGDLNASNRVMINGVPISGGGITDAPADGLYYVRRNAAWVQPDDTGSIGVVAGGITQATATPVSGVFTVVSIVPIPGAAVRLDVGAFGRRRGIKNAGANPLQVFPGSGARINTLAVDTDAKVLQPDELAWFEGESVTQWHS